VIYLSEAQMAQLKTAKVAKRQKIIQQASETQSKVVDISYRFISQKDIDEAMQQRIDYA